MDEYIKREEAYREICTDDTLSGYDKAYCCEIIKAISASDVAQVRHGRWERTADGAALCTACKRKMNPSQYGYAFCSLCGAIMDGGQNNETY